MRYILDDNNYIKSVSFGSKIECYGKECVEYTGSIPSGYSSLGEWASNAVIQAYYISNGSLVYDAAKEATIQATAAEEAAYNKPATEGYVRDNFVSVNAQSLTNNQKAQVRSNIGAGTSNFSGSYNDLTNKPAIPDSLDDLTQNANYRTVTDSEKATWNGKSNFSGSYNDLTNKPTLGTQATFSLSGTTLTITPK